MYYYGARWYDPSIGRFISQDPVAGRLSDPQSLNPYVYVENLPTVLTDPSGRSIRWTWSLNDCDQTCAVDSFLLGLGIGAIAAVAVVTFQPELFGLDTGLLGLGGTTVTSAACAEECEPGIDALVSDVGSLTANDAGQTVVSDASGLLASNGEEAVAQGLTDDAVDTSAFWRTTENGGYDFEKTEIHHLLPKQFQSFFGRVLDINDYVVQLDRGVHKVLHGRGGALSEGWNAQWQLFIRRNPNAGASDILNYLGVLLDTFDF